MDKENKNIIDLSNLNLDDIRKRLEQKRNKIEFQDYDYTQEEMNNMMIENFDMMIHLIKEVSETLDVANKSIAGNADNIKLLYELIKQVEDKQK